ncbi:heparinase II/III family protein [Magnetospira sp. QH-2]|uniref:heparinase II/III family protein n=1 Tax=Magnetospira sp. (strain QH-2) TaxID=1288970 RepID=UPI0003E81159|nr:heparinase II/III family protein [Magnetospira sp. QH-2]CCQ75457.1 conserved protein of unknown function[Include Heparinase II/III-like protein] [Magnetospira sp. QH-2]
MNRFWRTVIHLRPEQLWHRIRLRVLRPWHASNAYGRYGLDSKKSFLVNQFLQSLWPGDVQNGQAMLNGTIHLLGQAHPFAGPVDWQAEGQTLLWRFTLHYFEWLADLEAEGSPEAAALGRSVVDDWIAAHPLADAVAWHPYPLSLRLVAWLRHGPFLLNDAPADFKTRFETALTRQARHLRRVPERDVGGNHLIKNLKAQTVAALCLGAGNPPMDALKQEVTRQILADGCHYELSPTYHLQVLADLLDLRALLADETPDWLSQAIHRMGGALAFFLPGDGGLAQFNDGDEGDPALINAVIDQLGGLPEAPPSLSVAGYHRLAADPVVLIMDCAKCCPDDLPAHAHADPLSFEMSVGAQRMIVNCGTYAYQDPAWRNRLRGTAAHSTVAVDGLDSAEVYGVFRLGRRPKTVVGVHDGNAVTGTHDGYRHLKVTHQRCLTLNENPLRLEGRDLLEGKMDGRAARAHFHLHPDVAVTREADHLRLTLPDGVTWIFEAKGGRLHITDSVYAPRMGTLRTAKQIILEMTASGDLLMLGWCLRPAPLSEDRGNR